MANKYTKGSFIVVPNSPALMGLEPGAQAVYIWLCFHANKDGECFPSRKTIAKEAGIKSVRTLDRLISLLVEKGLVLKEERFNQKKQVSNNYFLPIVEVEEGSNIRHGGGANFDTGGGANFDTQNSTQDITQSNETCEGSKNPPLFAKEIPLLLEYFVKINPSISYGNKTQRAALEKMLTQWGFEPVEAMVKKTIAVQGEKYAPVADTPAKMWNKLGELAIFFKKRDGKGAKVLNLDEE